MWQCRINTLPWPEVAHENCNPFGVDDRSGNPFDEHDAPEADDGPNCDISNPFGPDDGESPHEEILGNPFALKSEEDITPDGRDGVGDANPFDDSDSGSSTLDDGPGERP